MSIINLDIACQDIDTILLLREPPLQAYLNIQITGQKGGNGDAGKQVI